MSAPAELCLLACLFLGAGFSLASGASQTQDFTFVLPAGRAECFYQTAAKSDSVEVNYQVKKKNRNITLFYFYFISFLVCLQQIIGREFFFQMFMNNVINEELDFGPSCGEITVVTQEGNSSIDP